MQRDDFFVVLTNELKGSSINVFFKDGDFFYDGNAIIYKNIRFVADNNFYMRIGDFVLWNRKKNGRADFYFRGESGVSCVRQTVSFPKKKKLDYESPEISLFLYEKELNDFQELYQKIQDKEFFKEQLISIYPYCINGDKILLNGGNFFPVFLLKYLELESCYYYVKSNITLENLEKCYPEIKTLCLPYDKILKEVNSLKEGLDLPYFEEYIDLWWEKEINRETALRKLLGEVVFECKRRRDERIREQIKNKYTIDYVLKEYAQEIQKISNYEKMLLFLKGILEKQNYSDESRLKNDLDSFFVRYKIYEDEYTRFIKLAGADSYIVRYSEEKETRYYAGIYEESESFDVECMKKILSMFYDYVYIDGTTKYRPKIEEFPFLVGYAKDLINELLKKEVLKEIDGKFAFYQVENLNKIERKYLFYFKWIKSDAGLIYQKQRIKQKDEKYKNYISSLENIILSDAQFLECKNRELRVKYLKRILIDQLEQGKCNYFYCLNAYRDKKWGVCFSGDKAQNFLDELWDSVKRAKRKIN